MELLFLVMIALVYGTHGQVTPLFTDDELKECGIDPKNLKSMTTRWPDGRTINEQNQGATLSVTTTNRQPTLTYDFDSSLTSVLMYDADDKGCSVRVNILWFVVNIPDDHVRDGNTINNYTPPPVTFTPTRVTIVVAKQSRRITVDSSELSNTPVLGQTVNLLRREYIKDVLDRNDLIVTALNTFKTAQALPT